ncbi:hypothetical protein H8E07_06790 [bacterium]|nr:hypothetical protein [bacterium]
MRLITSMRRFVHGRIPLSGIAALVLLTSLVPLATAAPRAVLGELFTSPG